MHLKTYLKREGITQRAFSEMLNPPVSQTLVWQWCAGITGITLSYSSQIKKLTKGAVSHEDCEKMFNPGSRKTHDVTAETVSAA